MLSVHILPKLILSAYFIYFFLYQVNMALTIFIPNLLHLLNSLVPTGSLRLNCLHAAEPFIISYQRLS